MVSLCDRIRGICWKEKGDDVGKFARLNEDDFPPNRQISDPSSPEMLKTVEQYREEII